ncbi:hypothetical protein TrLO_g15431 [Triparma laevis f. longispina]|uniref:Uncharacterized protein n=1 Tax=Triparma laevis f. longispina TaxID=1714387 RepID=A0A9W7EFX5_9STRA|nr:hypothetical protein TrLO_g15431 [Triparma laevis f. longispina]
MPKPNVLTSAFSLMSTSCPKDITTYAKCVLDNHTNGSLEQGNCQKEFAALRRCFDQCRKKLRGGKR